MIAAYSPRPSRSFFSSPWRAVLIPVAIAVVIWALMSLSTTFVLSWIESNHEQLQVQNNKAIQAAHRLQVHVWRGTAFMRFQRSQNRLRSTWMKSENESLESLRFLKSLPLTLEERGLVHNIEKNMQSVASEIDLIDRNSGLSESEWLEKSKNLRELASQISNDANAYVAIQQKRFDEQTQFLIEARDWLHSGRLVVLFFGSMLVLVIGWSIAKGLHRRVGSLARTLRENMLEPEGPVEGLQVQNATDWVELQSLAERMGSRFRETTRELSVTRGHAEQAERLAVAGELAASLVHELRNPLTSIKLLLQLCRDNGQPEPSISSKRLHVILDEIDRMEKTLQGLLDFSRPAPMRKRMVDLRQVIRRTIDLVNGRAKKNAIEIEAPRLDRALLMADEERLGHVLCNLLINAMDSIGESGKVTIELVCDEETDRCQVRIADTGPGIDEQILDKLFTPFATTKPKGTGLGLAISHRIVDLHGGLLRAHNSLDGGAVFTIDLPLNPTSPTSPLQPLSQGS